MSVNNDFKMRLSELIAYIERVTNYPKEVIIAVLKAEREYYYKRLFSEINE